MLHHAVGIGGQVLEPLGLFTQPRLEERRQDPCDRSECGACTVMLDGVTTYSCSTLTQVARGRKITTIEGIAGPDGGLHKVQKAMIAELGPQCGFCTSGQVVAAVALLNRNPHPTIDEARRGMSGNLCKCGAYDHYLKAIMRASQEA